VIVRRRRFGEGSLRDRTQRRRIVGRDHDPEAIETASVAFHEARGDDDRQGGGDLVWIRRYVKDVHQELPTDVDSREPCIQLVTGSRVGAVDPSQNLIRTTASEGGPDEGPQPGAPVVGHRFILPCHPPTPPRMQDTRYKMHPPPGYETAS